MNAARAVREARRRAGLSQVELARRAVMHVQVVNRIDAPRGYLPSLADLCAVADGDRQELIAAIQEELDRSSPGFRVYRRRDR